MTERVQRGLPSAVARLLLWHGQTSSAAQCPAQPTRLNKQACTTATETTATSHMEAGAKGRARWPVPQGRQNKAFIAYDVYDAPRMLLPQFARAEPRLEPAAGLSLAPDMQLCAQIYWADILLLSSGCTQPQAPRSAAAAAHNTAGKPAASPQANCARHRKKPNQSRERQIGGPMPNKQAINSCPGDPHGWPSLTNPGMHTSQKKKAQSDSRCFHVTCGATTVKLVAHNRPQLLCMQPLGKPERSQHFTHQTNIAAAQPASAIHTHHTSTVHSRPVPSSVIPISRVTQQLYLPSHPPNHRPQRDAYSCVLVCVVQQCVRGSDP